MRKFIELLGIAALAAIQSALTVLDHNLGMICLICYCVGAGVLIVLAWRLPREEDMRMFCVLSYMHMHHTLGTVSVSIRSGNEAVYRPVMAKLLAAGLIEEVIQVDAGGVGDPTYRLTYKGLAMGDQLATAENSRIPAQKH